MSYLSESMYDKVDLNHYEQLGCAMTCMFYNRNYRFYHVEAVRRWTENAIHHKQIKFLFDPKGFAVSYITWAYLAPDTVDRLKNDSDFSLHPSEWNESTDPWVLDFCCKPGLGLASAYKFLEIQPWGTGPISWYSRKGKIFHVKP